MSKLTIFLSKYSLEDKHISGSSYFTINERLVKVSNHLPPSPNAFINELSIFTMVNSNTQYVVVLFNQFYIYKTFTELKTFLENWILITKGMDLRIEIIAQTKISQLKNEIIKFKALKPEIDKLKKENSELRINFLELQLLPFDISVFTKGQQKQIKSWM